MENMLIYNNVRVVPDNAQKKITGGRMNGKTDINPMWRLKVLTENFGPCGIGWKYEITKQWLEHGANDEVAAFVNINLYIKLNGEWSDAIPGTGGNMFVAKERNGMYTSDECYKMALTDAISVACKALGVGADIYWQDDKTKYDKPKQEPPKKVTEEQAKELSDLAKVKGKDTKKIFNYYQVKSFAEMTLEQYNQAKAHIQAS